MKYKDSQKEGFVDEICKQVSKGQSLVKVLEKNDNLPSHDAFYTWLLSNGIFAEKYARACVLRAEIEYEKVLRIADNNKDDYYTDENGKLKVDHENIQRSRLRVDTRKWWLSKMVPKIYGDKTHLIVEPSGNESSQGFDINLLKADTLALIERDLLANNTKSLSGAILSQDIQDAEEVK